METFFLSHGSPRLIIYDMPVGRFLESWTAKVYPQTPKAILMISGHWETEEPVVTHINGACATIHDYSGLPSANELQYPAPGAPELAKRVIELLKHAGFDGVEEDKTRGLDHGAWVPLMLMYPEAVVPVCQLSIQPLKDGTHHYNMGKALAPLKEEGVLIIGSGSATHNLKLEGPSDTPPPSWAVDFDNWLKESLLNGRYEDVNHYKEKAPYAKIAHPDPGHLYPLHVSLGATGEQAVAELIHQSWGFSSISYSSFKFKTS